MSDLRPGTTMFRIAELERITAEQRQDIRELLARLDVAERRIDDLERLCAADGVSPAEPCGGAQ